MKLIYNISKPFGHFDELMEELKGIDHKCQVSFLQLLNAHHLRRIIANEDNLYQLVKLIALEDRVLFLKNLGLDFVRNLHHKFSALKLLVNLLPSPAKFLAELMHAFDDFIQVLALIESEHLRFQYVAKKENQTSVFQKVNGQLTRFIELLRLMPQHKFELLTLFYDQLVIMKVDLNHPKLLNELLNEFSLSEVAHVYEILKIKQKVASVAISDPFKAKAQFGLFPKLPGHLKTAPDYKDPPVSRKYFVQQSKKKN